MVMAVAAVVIVICLLASYAYHGDGDDGASGIRQEMELGDYFEYRMEALHQDGSVEAVSCDVTLVALFDDTAVLAQTTSWGDESYFTSPVSELFYDHGLDLYEPLGTEDVETGFAGTLSCEVYDIVRDGQEVRVWASIEQDVIVKTQEAQGNLTVTTVLWDTSLASPEPEYGSCTLDGDVVPGDICAYEVVGYDADSNPTGTGVFVKQFSSPSSLAQSTGQIQVGDVLLAIDSLPVNTTLDAKNLISRVGMSRISNTKTNRPILSFSRRCVV